MVKHHDDHDDRDKHRLTAAAAVSAAVDIDMVPVDQARFFPIMAAITNGSLASVCEQRPYLPTGIEL